MKLHIRSDGSPRGTYVENEEGSRVEGVTSIRWEIPSPASFATATISVRMPASEIAIDLTHATIVCAGAPIVCAGAPTRRSRTTVSSESLQRFSKAYSERFVSGRMAEFAESYGVSERQAYRLLKLAREHGFLAAA